MGLKLFVYKLRVGFARMGGRSLPHTTSAKAYGNEGEDSLATLLMQRIPSCEIKQNIMISIPEGNAEIDILVLYQNKLFAIEVKHWKGHLREVDGGIVQDKIDRWTDEIHRKRHKSPFKQLNRAIYLLRKQIQGKVWVHPIVYFEDATSVDTSEDNIWFSSIDELVSYITDEGNTRISVDATAYFDACTAADRLYALSGRRTLYGHIYDDCLRFQTQNGFVTRREILDIYVKHHWTYDELYIKTTTGEELYSTIENDSIEVFHDGWRQRYALCKIDYIQLG